MQNILYKAKRIQQISKRFGTNPPSEPFRLPKLSRTCEATAAAQRCPLHPGGGFVPVGPRSATAPSTRPRTKRTRTPARRGDAPAESCRHRHGPHRNTSNRHHLHKQSRHLPSGAFRNRQGWQHRGPRKEGTVSWHRLCRSPVPAAAKADRVG